MVNPRGRLATKLMQLIVTQLCHASISLLSAPTPPTCDAGIADSENCAQIPTSETEGEGWGTRPISVFRLVLFGVSLQTFRWVGFASPLRAGKCESTSVSI